MTNLSELFFFRHSFILNTVPLYSNAIGSKHFVVQMDMLLSWSCDLDQIHKHFYPLCVEALMKFKTGPVVSEMKPFENVDRQLTCDLWPRSSNDLDLWNSLGVKFDA